MAFSFNKVILGGNLTRDPEMRSTQSGKPVCGFGMAINSNRSAANPDGDTVFVDATAWEKTAETICKYLTKGSPALIEGRLVLDEWDDRQTGQKRSKLTVTVTRFVFVPDGKRDGQADAPAQTVQSQAPAQDDDDVPW